jgi:hypothetical protein
MTGLADELKSLPRRKTAPVIDEEIPRESYAGVVLREIDVSIQVRRKFPGREGSLDYVLAHLYCFQRKLPMRAVLESFIQSPPHRKSFAACFMIGAS